MTDIGIEIIAIVHEAEVEADLEIMGEENQRRTQEDGEMDVVK